MITLPQVLVNRIFKEGMRMPQVTLYLPANTSITLELTVPENKALVFVGFSFTGRDVNGNPLPSYDFTTNKGITWKAIYRNYPPLQDYESSTFYITSDIMDKQVWYGPRIVTKAIETTITNSLDVDVWFTQTAYVYEVYLEEVLKIIEGLKY
mgnify:CR=1 FL=1